jgi:hypothetical protein
MNFPALAAARRWAASFFSFGVRVAQTTFLGEELVMRILSGTVSEVKLA